MARHRGHLRVRDASRLSPSPRRTDAPARSAGCAVLWAKGRLQGRIASFLAFLAIAVTGDIPRAILEHVEEGYTFSSTSLSGKVQMAVLTRPAPLALVIMMIFFLWQYSRPTAFNTEAGKSRELEKESNYLT